MDNDRVNIHMEDTLLLDDVNTLESKYVQAMSEVAMTKERLVNLREKEDILTYANYKNINIITSVIAVFMFFVMVNLLMHINLFLLFANSNTIFLRIILILGSISFVGVVDVIVFKKIRNVLQKKIYDIIVKSSKYKKLMEDIKNTSSLLDEKLAYENRIANELLDRKSKCAIADAEKKIREVLLSYNNNYVSKVNNDDGIIKSYARRLVRNRCNRDIK